MNGWIRRIARQTGPQFLLQQVTFAVLLALPACGRTSVDGLSEGNARPDAGPTRSSSVSTDSGGMPLPDEPTPAPSAEGILDWVVQMGTEGVETASDVEVGPDENIVVVGQTSGGFAGERIGFRDAFAVKLSPDGELLWRTQFGSSVTDAPHGVALDGAGNVYAAGETNGPLEGELHGEKDAFLVKLSATGSLSWQRQLGTIGEDSALSVAVDQAGNPVMVGSTEGALAGRYVSATDMFAVEFSSTGDPLWQWQEGAPVATWERDRAEGVAIDSSGDVIVAGRTTGLFGQEHFGGDDVVLVKLSADGQRRWATQLGSDEFDVPYGVATDANDDIVVVGITHGALGDGGGDAPTNDGAFVAKYAQDGELLWVVRYGEDDASTTSFLNVVADHTGAIFVVGYVYQDAARPELGDAYAILAKFSAEGDLLWVERLSSGSYDTALGVTTDPSGGVVIVGYTSGSLAAELLGDRDLFVARYR